MRAEVTDWDLLWTFGRSVLRAMVTVRRPRPSGVSTVDHHRLEPILATVAAGGIEHLAATGDPLNDYLEHLSQVDPEQLSRDEALAFWVNLYNAGALTVAAEARALEAGTVLRVPGAFQRPITVIAGETLSLDGIEHGKIRRFGDPRIHAGLVCGSVSCPTLRAEPYTGEQIGSQLEDQMRRFLATGGLGINRSDRRVSLSRIFRWYGADFVRPRRMPTLLPAAPRSILRALARWVDPGDAAWIETTTPDIGFQRYDWGLHCAVT
ncbi:DUF547 domain-containing protein [soil metagenome]